MKQSVTFRCWYLSVYFYTHQPPTCVRVCVYVCAHEISIAYQAISDCIYLYCYVYLSSSHHVSVDTRRCAHLTHFKHARSHKFLCLNANNHWLCLRVMIVVVLRWVTVISSSIKLLTLAKADAQPLIAANSSDNFWIAFLANPLKGSWRLFEHHCPYPVCHALPFCSCIQENV